MKFAVIHAALASVSGSAVYSEKPVTATGNGYGFGGSR
ncbi:hypothetical protein PENSTE_c006G03580 [Penicillium steckii]|uniref:Uncharacterized protein n=1 Tax=Penicillium steckii TaxID=303698 RepID=A0A1V6TH58_9EURO|nr:hypothetical protein PENSTE_c006G03580 [Penicillium steckii]